jgi:amino acid permease
LWFFFDFFFAYFFRLLRMQQEEMLALEEVNTTDDEVYTTDVKVDEHPSTLPIGTSGSVFTIANIAKNMVGSSILSMSYVVSLGGIVPSVLVALGSGMVSSYTFSSLGRLCGEAKVGTYREIVEFHLGKKFGPWTDLLLAVNTLPVCLSYHISILGCLSAMLGTEAWYAQKWFLSTMLSLGVFLPLCSTEKINMFSYVSLGGIIAIVICFGYTSVVLGQTASDGDLPDISTAVWGPPSGNPLALLPVANIFASCFLVHYNAPSFYGQMKTKSKFAISTTLATTGVFLFCVTYAILGFAQFGFDTPDNILLGYNKAYIPWVAMCISLAATYPFVFDAARRSVISATAHLNYPRKIVFWTTNLACIPVFTVLAMFVQSLELVNGLNGALLGNLVGFVVPGILLVAKGGEGMVWYKNNRVIGYALVVMGGLLVVLGVAATFVTFKE